MASPFGQKRFANFSSMTHTYGGRSSLSDENWELSYDELINSQFCYETRDRKVRIDAVNVARVRRLL